MKLRTLQPGEALKPGEYCRYGNLFVWQRERSWVVIDDAYHQYGAGDDGFYVEPEPKPPAAMQREIEGGADTMVLDDYDGIVKPAWRVWAEQKQRRADELAERRTYGYDLAERQAKAKGRY